MRFTIAAAGLALVAGANAWGNDTVYTTEIVTAYTTYCPAATSIVHGNSTYTVTEATTLTITNCPCTVTRPVYTSTVSSCTSCSTSAAPIVSVTPPAFYNTTTIVATSTPVPASTTASTTAAAIATGAGSRALAASGAGLAGVLAFAAYIL